MSAIFSRVSLESRNAITSKTTTYQALASDSTILVTTASAWTLTLPAAAGLNGKRLFIKKTSSDLNALTIDGSGDETVEGAASTSLNTQYESVLLECDGTNWHIMQRHIDGSVVAFTPTGAWNTNVTYAGFRRRIGDHVELVYRITLSGAPNAANLTLNYPTGCTPDTAKMLVTAYMLNGMGNYKDAGGGDYAIVPYYNNTSNFLVVQLENPSTTIVRYENLVNATAPITGASGDILEIRVCYPVSGWKA